MTEDKEIEKNLEDLDDICDECKFLLNFNVSISSNIWDKEMTKLAKKVEISFLNNEDKF